MHGPRQKFTIPLDRPSFLFQHTGGIRAETGMMRAERDRDDVANGSEPSGGGGSQAQAQAQAQAQGQG